MVTDPSLAGGDDAGNANSGTKRPLTTQRSKLTRPRRSARRRRPQRGSVLALVLPLVGVLLGGLITSATTWFAEERQYQQAAEELLRIDRHEAYQAFSDAANNYAVAAQQRFDSCVAGSDAPLTDSAPCSPVQDVYQNARYLFHGARQDVILYGSERAVQVAHEVALSLPNTTVGFTGDPIDLEEPLETWGPTSIWMSMFEQVTRCEATPVSPENCAEQMQLVDDLLALPD